MQKGRPTAASKRSHSANCKDARDQSPDARKIPDHFSRKLFAFPGAKDALERLAAGGMSKEVTTAFLHAITLSPDDPIRFELPRPEDLRRAAARICRVQTH
jgi:hypothetical protein